MNKVWLVVNEDRDWTMESPMINVFSTKEKAIECFRQRVQDEIEYSWLEDEIDISVDKVEWYDFFYEKDSYLHVTERCSISLYEEKIDSFIPKWYKICTE